MSDSNYFNLEIRQFSLFVLKLFYGVIRRLLNGLQITMSANLEKLHNDDIIINVKAPRQIMDTFILTKDFEVVKLGKCQDYTQ